MHLRPFLATLAILAVAGCATAQQNVAACQIPPQPQVEVIPKAPVSEQEQIWQPGHWDWNGATYTWRPGTWIRRDGRLNQWMDGYWSRATVPGPCMWNPPHWV